MACAGKKFRGAQGYCRPRRREFSKTSEIFLRKLQKCSIFAYFAKDFQKHVLNYRAFGRKAQLVGQILKFFDENSMEKLNFYLFLGK